MAIMPIPSELLPAGLMATVSLIAMQMADNSNAPLHLGNMFADPFDDESFIDSGVGGIDSFAKTLLHFDGLDGATTFVDSATVPHTWTRTNTGAITTAQSKFGGSSLSLLGNSILRGDGSTDFAFGTGDFTIDWWMKLNATPSGIQYIFDFRTGAQTNSLAMYFSSANLIYYADAEVISAAVSPGTSWNHYAIARASGVTKLFVNGVQVGTSYTDSKNYVVGATNAPRFGSYNGEDAYFTNAWFDEIRISKGVARWSSNFTPPAGPYSVTASGTQNTIYNAATDLYSPSVIAGTDQTVTHTTHVASGNTASASTEYTAGGAGLGRAFHAFDKIISQSGGNNNWITNSSATGWIQYQFATAKTIGSYKLRSGIAFAARMAKDWTLLGSNTGAFSGEQVTLDTRSNQTAWNDGAGELRTYSVASPGSYLYYRLNVTANNGDASYLQIDEVNFLSPDVFNNATLVSRAITASSAPSEISALLQVRENEAAVAGTDYTLEFSRDNGTTWSTPATLTELFTDPAGNRIVRADSKSVTGQPTGTQIKWRFKTLNNKNVDLSGVCLSWS